MCLTKRYACFGDSRGDWELVLHERRHRGTSRTLGGRRELRSMLVRKGNRFAPLAAAVSEAEGSEEEI
jgi:hypothetical protein